MLSHVGNKPAAVASKAAAAVDVMSTGGGGHYTAAEGSAFRHSITDLGDPPHFMGSSSDGSIMAAAVLTAYGSESGRSPFGGGSLRSAPREQTSAAAALDGAGKSISPFGAAMLKMLTSGSLRSPMPYSREGSGLGETVSSI